MCPLRLARVITLALVHSIENCSNNVINNDDDGYDNAESTKLKLREPDNERLIYQFSSTLRL